MADNEKVKEKENNNDEIEFKIITLGNAGVGKTSIIERFVNDDYNRCCLKEQISILQPHLIIGSNVGELKDVLGYEDCDTTEKECFYYPPTPDGCFPPFLDCYHFAAIKGDENGFYIPVCKVIKKHESEIEDYMRK